MTGSISTVLFILLVGSITAQPPNGPASCDPGTMYDSSLFACILCGVGKYCPGGSPANQATATPCTRGWYSEAGASSCSPCPPGTLAAFGQPGDISKCVKCPAGTYQPYSNNSLTGNGWNDVAYGTGGADNNCIPCPLGTYSLGDGVGSCDGLLPDGIMHIYFPPGYKGKGDTSPLGAFNKNQSCAAGWRCGYGTNRYQCPIGTYAAAGDNECKICPKGAICSEVGLGGPKYNWCNYRYLNDPNYIKAYQDQEGATNVSFCKVCPSNTAALHVEYYSATIDPIVYPHPRYDDVSKCVNTCNPKQVWDGTQCSDCPAGHAKLFKYFNPSGSSIIATDYNATCVSECPPGTYKGRDTSWNQNYCTRG